MFKECEALALQRVVAERARQRIKFDDDHDDQHDKGEIVVASILIAMDVDNKDADCIHPCGDDEEDDWMHELALHVRQKYGQNYKQRLVISAAMLLAEIERLERLEKYK